MPKESAKQLTSALPSNGGAKQHWSLDVAFPVYAIGFTDDKTIVLAGGGGSSRTGVKNRLSMYSIETAQRTFTLEYEHELSKDEDAPMTIAILPQAKAIVAGINSSTATLKQGKNENLRVFSYDGTAIKFENAKQTLKSADEDQYQKVTAFSRTSPTLLAIGSTDSQMSLHKFPELTDVYPSIEYEGKELFDLDFDDTGDLLIGTSSDKLCAWPTKAPIEGQPLETVQVIERPVLKASLNCTFRAAKFGRGPTKSLIYTIVNAAPAVRTRKPAAGDKKSFVSMWDTKTWKLVKTRTVSQKPVTADDGSLLAYGSSDLSVGILDATTLRPIMTVLHAHEFPVTAIKFNPAGTLVVSGSADNTVRIIEVPPKDQRAGRGALTTLLLTILVLILAVYIQSRYGNDLLKAAGVF
ncbi:hypothetical protein OIV83_003828 [Microbotryomycetes sp. JL201]|nr:hypothetical protein OIV83_003828 [Microbotryomycetes sp. JL201]